MRFFITYDNSHAICGWIVPDNPLAISRVAVSVEGKRIAEVEAQHIDPVFKQSGLHSTGQCTFIITAADIPQIADLTHLELYDADTNVLVYRRAPREGTVEQRVMLINTGIEPETTLQTALFPHFHMSHFGIHRMSDEILTSILTNRTEPSLLLSGAIVVPRYEDQMTPDLMLTGILLQEPHVELATRMLWLKARAEEAADPARRWRLGRLADAATFAQDYDLTDLKSLRRYFRMLPEPAYHLLYNPLTRLLGTRMPDDRLHPGNSIAAIEVLARVGIVGHRTRFDAFAQTLFDRLELDRPIPAMPEPSAEARALAERLRAVRPVDEMLVFDIAMSDAVKDSIDKSWHH
ncbi:hypothetical protein Q8W71_16005 [Methylobacterium sp. NEAU 140]|uniref:hypothetical protein n=1 Tax=Methylobacterium sp. NEAU 140 TaxID=3064945 RepID=UPI0027364C8C|nr:hypothetical protein [Methylobacterium sp. NEAU 140]MDP4024134.1 hypothetical protein [Methylobacterium sp. NEAU 140]